MSIIDDRTKVPLSWAIGLLFSIASVISTAAISHYRLNQLEDQWKGASQDAKESVDRTRTQDLKIQRLEDKLDNIERFMRKIDERLERMESNANVRR